MIQRVIQNDMELVEPRPKKCRLAKNLPLPIILKKDNTISKIMGVYNGFSVVVEDREDMKNIISMGYFGKANLSRSFPQFTFDDKVEIIRQRQYERRKQCGEYLSLKDKRQVLVVPDSDEEHEHYFINLKPHYEIHNSSIKETVWLSPEEAFFLNKVVKCLDINHDNQLITPEKCWDIFTECNQHFQLNYITYCHFRAKNWVVKPGIKFGGDFLLYKQGPPFYHASYVVIIDVLDHNLQRIECLTRRSLDNLSIHGLNRLCETAGKELLMLQIILPEFIKNPYKISYCNTKQINVKEVLVRRWISNQQEN